MARSDLLQKLSEEWPDLHPRDLASVVDTFFQEISAQIVSGGRVELRGFGVFERRDRKAHSGRNPKTGEVVEVPEKRVPFFKQAKAFRRRLNDD